MMNMQYYMECCYTVLLLVKNMKYYENKSKKFTNLSLDTWNKFFMFLVQQDEGFWCG